MNYTQVLDDDFCDGDSRFLDKVCQVAELVVNGTKHRVYNRENVIGRVESCDILIDNPLCSLYDEEKTLCLRKANTLIGANLFQAVSTRHAVIEVEGRDSHVVYDLGSTNKTKLGQMTLKPHIRYHLRDCETLMFGNVFATYKYVYEEEDDKIHDKTPPVIIPESPERLDIPSGVVPETPAKETFVAESVIETSTDLFLENGSPHKTQDIYEADTETLLVDCVDESTVNDSNVTGDIYDMATQTFDAPDSSCNNQSESDSLIKNDHYSPTSKLESISSSINKAPTLDCSIQENNKKVIDSLHNQNHDGAVDRIHNNVTEKIPKVPDAFGLRSAKDLSVSTLDNEFSISEVPTQTFDETVISDISKQSEMFNSQNAAEVASDDCSLSQMMTQAFPIERSSNSEGVLEGGKPEFDTVVNQGCERNKHLKTNLNLSEMLTQPFTTTEDLDSTASKNTELKTSCDSNRKSKNCKTDLNLSEMLTQPFTTTEDLDSTAIKNTEEKTLCDNNQEPEHCKNDLNLSDMLTQPFTSNEDLDSTTSKNTELKTPCDSFQKPKHCKTNLNLSEMLTQPFSTSEDLDSTSSKNTEVKLPCGSFQKSKHCETDLSLSEMLTQPFANSENLNCTTSNNTEVPKLCLSVQKSNHCKSNLDVSEMFTQSFTGSSNVDIVVCDSVPKSLESNQKIQNNFNNSELPTQPFPMESKNTDVKSVTENYNDFDIFEMATQPFLDTRNMDKSETILKLKSDACDKTVENTKPKCENTDHEEKTVETVEELDNPLNNSVSDMFTQPLIPSNCENVIHKSEVNESNMSIHLPSECLSEGRSNLVEEKVKQCKQSFDENSDCVKDPNELKLDSNIKNTTGNIYDEDLSDMCTQPFPSNNVDHINTTDCLSKDNVQSEELILKQTIETNNSIKSPNKSDTLVNEAKNLEVADSLNEPCQNSYVNNNTNNELNLLSVYDMETQPDDLGNISAHNSDQTNKSEAEMEFSDKETSKIHLNESASDMSLTCQEEKKQDRSFLLMKMYSNYFSDDEEKACGPSSSTVKKSVPLILDKARNTSDLIKNSILPDTSRQKTLSDNEEYSEVLKKKSSRRSRKISSDSESDSANKKLSDKQNIKKGNNKRRLSDDDEYSEVLKKKSNRRPRKISSDSENDSANEKLYKRQNSNKSDNNKRRLSYDDEEYSEVLKKKSHPRSRKLSSDSENDDSAKEVISDDHKLNRLDSKRKLYDSEEYSEVVKKKSNLHPRMLSSDSENESVNENKQELKTDDRKKSNDNEIGKEVLKKILKLGTGKIVSESVDRNSTDKLCDVRNTKLDIVQEKLLSDGNDSNFIQETCPSVQCNTEKSKTVASDSTLSSNTGEYIKSELKVKSKELEKCSDDEIVNASNVNNSVDNQLPTCPLTNELPSSVALQSSVNSNNLSAMTDTVMPQKLCAEDGVECHLSLDTKEIGNREIENGKENEKIVKKLELISDESLGGKEIFETDPFIINQLGPVVNSTPKRKSFKTFKKIVAVSRVDKLKSEEKAENTMNDSVKVDNFDINSQTVKDDVQILGQKTSDNSLKVIEKNSNESLDHIESNKTGLQDIPLEPSESIRKKSVSFEKGKNNVLSSPEVFLGFPESTKKQTVPVDESFSNINNVQNTDRIENNQKNLEDLENKDCEENSKKVTSDVMTGPRKRNVSLRRKKEEIKITESEEVAKISKRSRRGGKQSQSLNNIKESISHSEVNNKNQSVAEDKSELSSEVLGRGKRIRTKKRFYDNECINIGLENNEMKTDTEQADFVLSKTRKGKKNLKNVEESGLNSKGCRNIINDSNTALKDQLFTDEGTKPFNLNVKINELKSDTNTNLPSSGDDSFDLLLRETLNSCSAFLGNLSNNSNKSLSFGSGIKVRRTYSNKKLSLLSTGSETTTVGLKRDTESDGHDNVNLGVENNVMIINSEQKDDSVLRTRKSRKNVKNNEESGLISIESSTLDDRLLTDKVTKRFEPKVKNNDRSTINDVHNRTQNFDASETDCSKSEDTASKSILVRKVRNCNVKKVTDEPKSSAERNTSEKNNIKKRKCRKGQDPGAENELSVTASSVTSDDSSRHPNELEEQHTVVDIKIEEPDEQPHDHEDSTKRTVKKCKSRSHLRKTVENEKDDVSHEIVMDKPRISVIGNSGKSEKSCRKESSFKVLKEESLNKSTCEEETSPKCFGSRTSTRNKNMDTSVGSDSKGRKCSKRSKDLKISQVTKTEVKDDTTSINMDFKKRDSSTESLNTSRSGRTLKKPSLNQGPTHYIMFTGYSDPKMNALVKRLGGDIVDDPFTCTVLVTDKVRRTIKFLCSLAKGCPIVSPQWLVECRKSSRFLDPDSYLLSDTETEKKFSFNLKSSIEKARSVQLLKGWTVYVTPSVKPPPEEMKSIIEISGGTFLPRVPSKWPTNSVVVSSIDDKSKWNTLKKHGTTPLIANAEIILTGVLQQTLDVNAYKIT